MSTWAGAEEYRMNKGSMAGWEVGAAVAHRLPDVTSVGAAIGYAAHEPGAGMRGAAGTA